MRYVIPFPNRPTMLKLLFHKAVILLYPASCTSIHCHVKSTQKTSSLMEFPFYHWKRIGGIIIWIVDNIILGDNIIQCVNLDPTM